MSYAFEEFALPDKDSGPYGLTYGKDGAVWFTEQIGNRIGRMTPDGR
ncbi:virginiamycin B lyase [Paenibacillus sp. UNC499MF]|nr:virginiamycin B lyase [Paenibacillus sp. UNC499MF]